MNVDAQAPSKDLVLDPFSYVPYMASRIQGLGGDGCDPEGDYAFHTPYVAVAEGVAHFTVRFEGLTATSGTLNLRVHMLSSDSPHAKLATAERIALNRLILIGGSFQIKFEAFHGVTYALYGGIVGDSDARAESAHVVLDRPADPNERFEISAEARDTLYGRQVASATNIVSLATPVLSVPVTQPATLRQLGEATARGWIKDARLHNHSAVEQWRAAFLLQALKSYGHLEQGARGLGLGCQQSPVPAVLAAHGVAVDVVEPRNNGEEVSPSDFYAQLQDSGLCERADLDARVQVREAALDPPSANLVNYDFLWTDGICDRLDSANAGAHFMEIAMTCIRPGGLAVHIVRYDPDADQAGRVFGRNHIERICLILISRAHDIAEFRIGPTDLLRDEHGISACAVICRKASLRA